MSDDSFPTRVGWKDWLLGFAPLVVVITALLAGGSYIGQVRENTRRVELLEQRNTSRDTQRELDRDQLQVIDVRTARIEAKLEVLLPAKERQP